MSVLSPGSRTLFRCGVQPPPPRLGTHLPLDSHAASGYGRKLRPRTMACGRQAKFAFPSSTLLRAQDATWISFRAFNDSLTLTEYFSFELASLDVPSIFMLLLIESKTGLSVLYL